MPNLSSTDPRPKRDASADRAQDARLAAIRALNDNLRRVMISGKVMITAAVAALAHQDRRALIEAVQAFDAFTPHNDPYGEHDFGSVEVAGSVFFWKIDAYDLDLRFGSPDPADPTVTRRVLTIMAAEEY